jgi:hypothetical protein
VTVSDLVENLPAHVVSTPAGFRDIKVGKVVATDLMSDVLVSVETDILLVTSLATDQTIRSADIMGASVILLVNDKLPPQSMKALAEECGIVLLATPLPTFEACIAIHYLKGRE